MKVHSPYDMWWTHIPCLWRKLRAERTRANRVGPLWRNWLGWVFVWIGLVIKQAEDAEIHYPASRAEWDEYKRKVRESAQ